MKRQHVLDPLLNMADMPGRWYIFRQVALPEHFQAKFSIGSKGTILGYECKLVGDCLPNNQTVKRVFVFHSRQVMAGGGIISGNRQYITGEVRGILSLGRNSRRCWSGFRYRNNGSRSRCSRSPRIDHVRSRVRK